jgi:hypothetical protein
MSEVFSEVEEAGGRRLEFQRSILQSVQGVKALINAVREDYKGIKLKPKSGLLIKENIEKKKKEI